MGLCGEMIGAVRFVGLCVCLLLVGLGFSNVSGFVGGDGIHSVGKFLISSAFLPPDTL